MNATHVLFASALLVVTGCATTTPGPRALGPEADASAPEAVESEGVDTCEDVGQSSPLPGLLGPATGLALTRTASVILDPEADIAYLASRGETAMLAVDLSDGHVLWQSSQAVWPLEAFHGAVLGQRGDDPGCLRLVLLDSRDGGLLTEWHVELPPFVVPSYDWNEGSVFWLEVVSDTAADAVTLYWSHQAYQCSGVERADGFNDPTVANGHVRIDRGGVTDASSADSGGDPESETDQPGAIVESVFTGVGSVNGSRVLLEVGSEPSGVRVYRLIRFDEAGERVSEVLIARGVDAYVMPSVDQRYVATGLRQYPAGEGPQAISLYDLTHFEDGPVASLELDTGSELMGAFAVMGTHLVWTPPDQYLPFYEPGSGNPGTSLNGVDLLPPHSTWRHEIDAGLELICLAP